MSKEPYSTIAILRRNVADLELALRTQTELKEKAEAEVVQLQRWKEEQLWIWEDVDAYARERTPLGKSVCETALDLMKRAEAAEAELARLREQEPLTWGTSGELMDILKNPIYSSPAPVPAPAVPELDPMTRLIVSDPKQIKPKKQEPAVPEEWRDVMQDAHDTFQRYADQHRAKDTRDSHEKANVNQKLANRLYALLQSAEGSNAAADRLLEGGE